MKYCVVILGCILALAFEINAQCLPGIAPVVASPAVVPAQAVVPAGSVANTLADTLSLLTVSSLLAEKLPLGSYGPVAIPSMVGGCGCGGYPYAGYPYGPILI